MLRYKDKGHGVRKATIFGFMVLNGNDVAMASLSSRAGYMMYFLELIRMENPERPIVVVLDNAMMHHARAVSEAARKLNIRFAFLPPYSPDLNPIEFSWKDMKRELASRPDFDGMLEASGPTALRLFRERKMSYSLRWRERFAEVIVNCR